MSGSSPAGAPSIDSGRGSFAIFSTWLKSLKIKVSGSRAARSWAVALSASRAVITVSAVVILIGTSPAPSCGVEVPADGAAGRDDSVGRPGEPGSSGALARDRASGPFEPAVANPVARNSGGTSAQVGRAADQRVAVINLMIMATADVYR